MPRRDEHDDARSDERGRARSGRRPARGSRRAELLVGFLTDPSPVVRRTVQEGLVAEGKAALPALRIAEKDDDALLRVRARDVVERIDFEHRWRRLVAHLSDREPDLETGLLRLGALAHDGRDPRPVRAALDRLGRSVERRVEARTSGGIAAAHELVVELCERRGFHGASSDYHHPDHVFLHRALTGRKGLPLTLVAIALLVARRAGVRATAVPLPGHVLLRLRAGDRSLLVDPFHGGRVRTRDECRRYLVERGLPVRAQWFEDASDRALLRRQVWNLHRAYVEHGQGTRAARLRAAGGLIEGLRGPVTTADTEGSN